MTKNHHSKTTSISLMSKPASSSRTMSDDAHVVTTHSGPEQIKEDLECFACGYNLRTLRSDVVCTECGGAWKLP